MSDLDKEELEATRNINKNYNTDLKNIIIEFCKITKAINDNALPVKGNRELCNLLEDAIYYLEKQDKTINLLVQQIIFYSEKFDDKFKYENEVKKCFIEKAGD